MNSWDEEDPGSISNVQDMNNEEPTVAVEEVEELEEVPTPAESLEGAVFAKTERDLGWVWTVVLVVVAVLVGAGMGGLAVAAHSSGTQTEDLRVESASAKVIASTVMIDTKTAASHVEGSGIIVRGDGMILTNNHVVAPDGVVGTVTVSFDGGASVAGKVLGRDVTNDLAVVQIPMPKGGRVAEFGDSTKAVVGERVIAVGSPLELEDTVSSGILSAKGRVAHTSAVGSGSVVGALQTDAAINPGNSGGPLADLDGKVLGVNTAIASVGNTDVESGSIGVGFAIPIETVKTELPGLMAGTDFDHAVLGVSVVAGDSGGAKVATVTAGGAADKAGLQVGDVITTIDGKSVDNVGVVTEVVRAHSPGDTITVVYTRDGKSNTASVSLGSTRAG